MPTRRGCDPGVVLALRDLDDRVRDSATASRVAILTGAVFIPAGLVKFVAYGWELDNFRRFGLPLPEAWVVTAGVVETLGGIALLRRRFVAPSVAVLAVTMAVAIAVSGVAQGDVVPSLTLAPALLVALLYLLSRAVRPGRR